MIFAPVFVTLCVLSAVPSHVSAVNLQKKAVLADWSRELDGPSPIIRVVKLLQEMKSQLEQESSSDAEAYDKMRCWCETNEQEKTQAIADGEAKITELLSEVERLAARDGELSTKIANLKQDIAEKKLALAKATKLRETEAAEFREEEKELVQAVTMLKNALVVLSRNKTGFLQLSPEVKESIGSVMRWASMKNDEMLALNLERSASLAQASSSAAAFLSLGSRTPTSIDAASSSFLHSAKSDLPIEFASKLLAKAATPGASFAQAPDFFNSKPTHLQSYAPQSGQVIGILKQLKEDFESNMSGAQKAELQAAADYAELKVAAEEEIEASAKQLDDWEVEFGGNTKALSDAKEDLGVTRETLSADRKFLSELRLQCQDRDHQWAQRNKARSEEIKAVAETIAILTEDDARTVFHKKLGSVAPDLLQIHASRNMKRAARNHAAQVLLSAARRLQQLPDMNDGIYKVWHGEDKPHERLAAMAVQVQIAAFTKIKAMMDNMIAELRSQQEEEVKHKAYCNDELHTNAKQTHVTKRELSQIIAKIEEIKASIEKLTQEIAEAKAQIVEMEVQLKKASEQRKEENAIFQQEVSDQRVMQQILNKALARMGKAYKTVLMQEDPTPPVHFQPYKKNAGGSPVMSLLQQIIGDSKAVEKEAMTTEQEAQGAYSSFVNEADNTIDALNDAIASKTESISALKVEKEEAIARRNATEGQLEDLGSTAADLHEECDFVLKNFSIRQKARLQEIEAIQKAKAYLSGMTDDNESDAP